MKKRKLPLRDLPKTVMKSKQNNEKTVICPQATFYEGNKKQSRSHTGVA